MGILHEENPIMLHIAEEQKKLADDQRKIESLRDRLYEIELLRWVIKYYPQPSQVEN